MMKNKYYLLFSFFLLTYNCNYNYIPKPYGYKRLDLPENKYEKYNNKNYSFEKSIFSNVIVKKNNSNFIDISYENLNAKIHCTYKKVNNNINEIIEDVEKFTYKHTIKAENIKEQLYENKEDKKIGMLYYIEGNTATNIQFYVTDKEKNIFSGSLYFWSHPNYDSLLPVVNYLEKDIKILMETLKWK